VIRCRKPFPPDQDVTDQFGRRTVQKLIPQILCGPARKGEPPPTEPCDATAPQCNGVCPNPIDLCLAMDTVPPSCQCGPQVACGQTFPQCNGLCPAATPNCVPVTIAGAPFCRCI
jgi:hypothetical protein